MICEKCGGTIHGSACLLCELFECGATQPPVEVERQNKPKASIALKVARRQIPEAMAMDKKKGVRVDYSKTGMPLFESRAHQAKYLKAYGYFNRDGGYGD